MPQPMTQRSTSVVRAVFLVLAIGLCAWLGVRYWPHRTAPVVTTARPATPTLVVVLRADGSGADAMAFARGVRDATITQLARIGGLRTIAPFSATLAQTLDAESLWQRLGATLALEGAMHDAGDRLRIDWQLREIPGGRGLWSQRSSFALADLPDAAQTLARGVAAALRLRAGAAEAEPPLDPQWYRAYLQTQRSSDAPQSATDIARLRALAADAPQAARIQAALARALAETLPPAPVPAALLDQARQQTARALTLGANLADAQFAQAILACRDAAWTACMDAFARARKSDPADTYGTIAYAHWLAAVGHVGAAVHEAQAARDDDPLNSDAAFTLARTLDTAGLHDGARRALDAVDTPISGLVYAKWFNAIWRRDWARARQLATAMPEEAGYRESYLAATEASINPALWPQALPLLRTAERANRQANVLRVLMPDSDPVLNLAALESMLRNGWPSYYMLLWMREYRGLRQGPAFQDFLKRTGLREYWSSRGWPQLCKPQGEAVHCN
jgi:TolB-like protein